MTLAKTANQSAVTVSGHKVEMHKGGSAPALLFLHGGGGFGTFDPTNSALSERFTVYAPSHPGFVGPACRGEGAASPDLIDCGTNFGLSPVPGRSAPLFI